MARWVGFSTHDCNALHPKMEFPTLSRWDVFSLYLCMAEAERDLSVAYVYIHLHFFLYLAHNTHLVYISKFHQYFQNIYFIKTKFFAPAFNQEQLKADARGECFWDWGTVGGRITWLWKDDGESEHLFACLFVHLIVC